MCLRLKNEQRKSHSSLSSRQSTKNKNPSDVLKKKKKRWKQDAHKDPSSEQFFSRMLKGLICSGVVVVVCFFLLFSVSANHHASSKTPRTSFGVTKAPKWRHNAKRSTLTTIGNMNMYPGHTLYSDNMAALLNSSSSSSLDDTVASESAASTRVF
jgi:hypothetical protein